MRVNIQTYETENEKRCLSSTTLRDNDLKPSAISSVKGCKMNYKSNGLTNYTVDNFESISYKNGKISDFNLDQEEVKIIKNENGDTKQFKIDHGSTIDIFEYFYDDSNRLIGKKNNTIVKDSDEKIRSTSIYYDYLDNFDELKQMGFSLTDNMTYKKRIIHNAKNIHQDSEIGILFDISNKTAMVNCENSKVTINTKFKFKDINNDSASLEINKFLNLLTNLIDICGKNYCNVNFTNNNYLIEQLIGLDCIDNIIRYEMKVEDEFNNAKYLLLGIKVNDSFICGCYNKNEGLLVFKNIINHDGNKTLSEIYHYYFSKYELDMDSKDSFTKLNDSLQNICENADRYDDINEIEEVNDNKYGLISDKNFRYGKIISIDHENYKIVINSISNNNKIITNITLIIKNEEHDNIFRMIIKDNDYNYEMPMNLNGNNNVSYYINYMRNPKDLYNDNRFVTTLYNNNGNNCTSYLSRDTYRLEVQNSNNDTIEDIEDTTLYKYEVLLDVKYKSLMDVYEDYIIEQISPLLKIVSDVLDDNNINHPAFTEID